MLRRPLLLLLAALALLLPAYAQTGSPAYLQEAFLGVNTLQGWYQPSTGLYQTTGWWNAGNSITVLANYARLDHTHAYDATFANTLVQAPKTFPNFLNDFYDDEGWWALAWIDVYDLTGRPEYLAAARTIFSDMTGAWDGTCGGGIWWSKARNYKNAIANELFLSVASSLAARSANGTDRSTYLGWAQREWAWFQGSGMINASHTINDGLDTPTCRNNGGTVWSYNQGVILGGLAQLSQLTGDTTAVTAAQTIANSAIAALTDSNGILHDPCEPNCGSDGNEFKGVFLRNLVALQAIVHDPRYTSFATANADSIFAKDRSAKNEFGVVWSGPFDGNPNAASQNSALDAILAAAAMTSTLPDGSARPAFTLSASPSTLSLGGIASAQATVALSSGAGFSGPVSLGATIVGAPAGLSATLGATSLSGSGTTTVTVTSSRLTPGGTYQLAVSGLSADGLFQTAYISLVLPDYAIAATPATLYLNQSGHADDTLAITPANGFSDTVFLAHSALPTGVTGRFVPRSTTTGSTLALTAASLAPTSSGTPVTITSTSGPTAHSASVTVAVSAALSDCGKGTPVDLSSAFNLTALHSDGAAYTDGGLDGLGFSYSSTLLGASRVLNGIRFTLGAGNQPDALFSNGQTIALPRGRFNTLQLLGTAINGRQSAQPVTVTYTDGTVAQLAQSFSDWFSPALNADEGEAVAMPYRNSADGSAQQVQFNLYSYTLPLDRQKIVQSLTLPRNRNVVLLAATLARQDLGEAVDLAGAYNLVGLYSDGTAFTGLPGVDGVGYAYSATVLGDTSPAGTDLTVGTASFHIAPANQPNVVYAAGQTIPIPAGQYRNLRILGSGVGGNQLDQAIRINFADGTSEQRTQSFSDWFSAGNYPGESLAVRTAYRNQSNGSVDNQAFNIYLYTLRVDPAKPISSITLPNNRSVVILGVTATARGAGDSEPPVCSSAPAAAPEER